MKKMFLLPLTAVLFACTQTQVQSSPSPAASASGTAAAASASPGAGSGRVELRVVTPESGARVGDDSGAGWSVDITARGRGTAAASTSPGTGGGTRASASPGGGTTGASASPTATATATSGASPAGAAGALCTPAFNAQGTPGRNAAFPGLVVTLSTTAQSPRQNLAGLFQIVSIDDTTANLCHAVWSVGSGSFGSDQDTELVAFIVEGSAPDLVPENRSGLRIVSNEVTVRFHIGGRRGAGSPSPSGSPAATRSPAASPSATTSASPSASPR